MAGIAGMGQPQDIQNSDQQYQAPVPNVEMLAQQAKEAASPSPQMPESQMPTPQPQDRPSLDDIFGAQSARPSLDDIFGSANADSGIPEEKNMAYANTMGLSQQMADLPTRAKAAFATTDKERLDVLKAKFGADNVKMATVKDDAPKPKSDTLLDAKYQQSDSKGEKVYMVKENGKWRRFGSSNELIGDVADFGRMGLEGVVQAGTTAASMAATGITAGTASPLAAGMIAGGGALAGKKAGDVVAQHVLGIPRDPSRSELMEDAGTFGIGAVLGAGTQKLFMQPTSGPADKIVQQEAQNTLQQVDRLKEQYGIDMPVTQASVLPRDNVTSSEMKAIGGSDTAKNFYEQAGKTLQDGWQKIISYVGDVTGKTGIGNQTIDIAANVNKIHGKVIQAFRAAMKDAAGDGELPVPKYAQAVYNAAKDLGAPIEQSGSAWKPIGDNPIKVNPNYLIEELGFEPRHAELIAGKVNNALEIITNDSGRMQYEEIEHAYKGLSAILDNNPDAALGFKRAAAQLRGAVRDDMTQLGGTLLDGQAKQNYLASMGRYANITDAADQLTSIIGKDAITTEALANRVINKNNLHQLKALRTMIEPENPDAWRELVGSHFNSLVGKNTNASGVTNWNAIRTQMNGLGNDVVAELWGKNGPQLMNDFLSNAAKLSEQQMTALNAPAAQGAIKKAIVSVVHLAHGDVTAAAKMLSTIQGENGLGKYFSRTDIEKLVSGLGDKKPLYRSVINKTVNMLDKGQAANQAMGQGSINVAPQ